MLALDVTNLCEYITTDIPNLRANLKEMPYCLRL